VNGDWQYPPGPVARTSGVNCLASGLVGGITVIATRPHGLPVLVVLAALWSAIGVVMIVLAPTLSRRQYLVMHLSGLTSIAVFCSVAGDRIAALSGIFLQILLVTPAFIVLSRRVARCTTLINAIYVVYLGCAVGDVGAALVINALLVLFGIAFSAGWVQSVASTSEVDELTKLSNRRRLSRELTESPSSNRSRNIETIAIVDIDRFKEINDAQGHSAGDRALTRVASSLRVHQPSTSLLIRSGGDEFTLLSSIGSTDELRDAIERVRRELAPDLSISAGIAERLAEESPRQTLERADGALLMSKHKGRDCTTVVT